MHKGAKRLITNSRMYAHAALLAVVGAVVLGSSMVSANTHSQALSQLNYANGLVATLDPTTSADLAANIAADSGSLAATIQVARVSDVASQGTLAGDDNALAKTQVISSAGSLRRTVTNYTVANGDTVESIAKKFSITSESVRWANNIKNDSDLKPAQSLQIVPVSGVLYTVANGDTADSIASKFHAVAAAINDFNDVDVKGLSAGRQIVVPDGEPVDVAAAAAAPANTRRTTTGNGSTDGGFSSSRVQAGGANGYTWGQCTWYVASRRAVPGGWGNAISWYRNAIASGWSVGNKPRAGAIGWEHGNHVVYVESANGDGTVTISEMNWNGRVGVVHYRTTPASEFSYIY